MPSWCLDGTFVAPWTPIPGTYPRLLLASENTHVGDLAQTEQCAPFNQDDIPGPRRSNHLEGVSE